MSDNITHIKHRIKATAETVGRISEDITLVAVTKTVPVDVVNEAIKLGITDVGENRVQEFLMKNPELLPVRKHLIGHLQSNKVKQIVGKVDLIHSVDSINLLHAINLQAEKLGITQDILMQINVSKEESKFGMPLEAVSEFTEIAKNLENVNLRGVMTIPPISGDKEFLKDIFMQTREIYETVDSEFDILSMGMSMDFELAITCGANMVRIGSGIFGSRM